MHLNVQAGGAMRQNWRSLGNSPSDLTERVVVLLSMGGWGIEAEYVCGEFLWATADILLDDEIACFMLRRGDPALEAGKAATRSAPPMEKVR